jgi:hypothetical protein
VKVNKSHIPGPSKVEAEIFDAVMDGALALMIGQECIRVLGRQQAVAFLQAVRRDSSKKGEAPKFSVRKRRRRTS